MLGSAAIVGAAASNVTASTLRAVVSPEAGAVLSVGFSDRTAPVVAEPNAPAATTVPANALRVSDASLRDSGVRVLVHGLTSPEHRASASVYLSTFAPAAEGAVPFLAWAHGSSRNGVVSTSPRASFVAALDEQGTLPIAIERRAAVTRWSRLLTQRISTSNVDVLPNLETLEQSGNVCRLTSGDRGDARLRAGTYFIALRHSSSQRQPDWRSIEVDWTDAGVSLRRNGAPVDFEYVALTVDSPTA